jgi:diguanylate cyclase (GGDEF)-like protein
MELLVGVLLLGALDGALLVWAARSERVTIHWPRRLQSFFESMRTSRLTEEMPPVRRRQVLVTDAGGSSPEIAAAAVYSPTRSAAMPGTPRRPLAQTLPPDLAELLSTPASLAADVGGRGQEATLLARLPQSPSAVGRGLGTDPLTGLEGPLGWGRIVEVENARLLRCRRPVTVVLMEVEGLHRLADRLGEEPIERLLPVVADALRREARASDWVARIGEGRFAALLPETDEIQAINYVERVRVVCEPWLASAAVPLRLAIGWSGPTASSDLEFAVRRAEERMHVDRRMPGRSFQAPRVVQTGVVAFPPSGEIEEPVEQLVGVAAEPEPVAPRARSRRKARAETVPGASES